MPHLVATLIYLSQNYSYYIRGDKSPLKLGIRIINSSHLVCDASFTPVRSQEIQICDVMCFQHLHIEGSHSIVNRSVYTYRFENLNMFTCVQLLVYLQLLLVT